MKGTLLARLCAAMIAVAPASLAAEESGPSPAVVAMREQWLLPNVNSFTFRDTNKVFEFRMVHRAGPVRSLPRGAALVMPAAKVAGAERDYQIWAERTFTNALLVIRDGRIIFEDYRNRSGPDTHFISFSMAKSIVSLLVGKALEQGHIASLDDPAGKYVPELKGGAYGDTSIRHILQMRSGADIEERYDFGQNPSLAAQIHQNAIVLNKWRFADPARTIGRRTPAGSTFNYATLDTAVLGWILERATGKGLAAYTEEVLWRPAGMESDAWWMADGPPGVGRELSGMGFNATLRDFGRLGLLMLDDGVRGKKRVLASGWMSQATRMVPHRFPEETKNPLSRGYGFQFWQLDDEPGAYTALGLAGQFIYVHPATRTVIVKLSYFPPVEPDYVLPETVDYFHRIVRMK